MTGTGTEWTVPGQGDTLGELRQAIQEPTSPRDWKIVTDLKLTGRLLDRRDWTRIREVCARPEIHQGVAA